MPSNYISPPTQEELHQNGLPLLKQAKFHAEANRVLSYDNYYETCSSSQGVTYKEVLDQSSRIHEYILREYHAITQQQDTTGGTRSERIAFFCTPSSAYIASQWACWSTGSIAVPLCISHTAPELHHVLQDCDPFLIIVQCSSGSKKVNWEELEKAAKMCSMLNRVVFLEDILGSRNESDSPHSYQLGQNNKIESMDSPALIIYTSGTTGKPKGVVSSHRTIHHQIVDLVLAWEWKSNDCILHFLPLHHVHGIINKLCCAVWAGASIDFMKFVARRVWKRLGDTESIPVTLLHFRLCAPSKHELEHILDFDLFLTTNLLVLFPSPFAFVHRLRLSWEYQQFTPNCLNRHVIQTTIVPSLPI